MKKKLFDNLLKSFREQIKLIENVGEIKYEELNNEIFIKLIQDV
jgi:hypothetical protein